MATGAPTSRPERGPAVLVCSQGFPRHPDDFHAAFVLDHARALVAAGATVEVSCPAGPDLPTTDTYPAGPDQAGESSIRIRRFRYAPRRFETLAYSGGMHHRARGSGALLLPLFVLGFLVDVIRRARRVDVIHAHWWLPSGVVAVVAGRLTRTPVVVQIHGTDAAMATGILRHPARFVLRSASAVVAVSDSLARWVADVAGVEATVLPMPLRTSIVPSGDPDPAPADGPIVAVGRLVPEKGFDVLIRAVARAEVRLVLIGDGGQRPVLEALAAEVGADVTFVGPVPPHELGAHYRSARLVAVPSHREGFGLVAAEALASGRAVVASAVGGLTQVVADGVTGCLVPAGSVDALASALVDTDPALGAAGPTSVAWIHPERIGTETVALYRRVLADA